MREEAGNRAEMPSTVRPSATRRPLSGGGTGGFLFPPAETNKTQADDGILFHLVCVFMRLPALIIFVSGCFQFKDIL